MKFLEATILSVLRETEQLTFDGPSSLPKRSWRRRYETTNTPVLVCASFSVSLALLPWPFQLGPPSVIPLASSTGYRMAIVEIFIVQP